MWKLRNGRFRRHAPAVTAFVCFGMVSPLWADSVIIQTSPGYEARDLFTSQDPIAIDVFGNQIATYADSRLRIYNRSTQQLLWDLGNQNYDAGAYNSFVTFDPAGDSVWVGFTVGGNVNDRIYQVDVGASPAWNHVATLASNYELAFRGTVPYVSGLNDTTFGGPNKIWRLDTTGQNAHTLVADVGGFAAGIAFDSQGNLYYATNLASDNKLVRFSAQQVTDGDKSLSDAEVLSSLPYFGTDTEVDGGGNVLVNMNDIDFSWNQLGSTLAMWDGTPGTGENYEEVGSIGEDHWYYFVRALGDLTGTGTAYLSDGGAWLQPVLGVAEIRSTMAQIPEPSSLVLSLVAASLLLLGRPGHQHA